MATYDELRDKALRLSDEEGNSDAQAVAEDLLVEAMKYVATFVRLDNLVGSAQHTWVDGDTEADLFGSDFTIADASAPLEPLNLFVASDATSNGTEYSYRRFLDWKRLQGDPIIGRRSSIFDSYINDNRPYRNFTIDPSNRLVIDPVPQEDAVVTIHYKIPVAAYVGANTPEIPGDWDFILVSGAILGIKEFIRQPDAIIDPYNLFVQLDPHLKKMEWQLRGRHTNPRMKIANSYKFWRT